MRCVATFDFAVDQTYVRANKATKKPFFGKFISRSCNVVPLMPSSNIYAFIASFSVVSFVFLVSLRVLIDVLKMRGKIYNLIYFNVYLWPLHTITVS